MCLRLFKIIPGALRKTLWTDGLVSRGCQTAVMRWTRLFDDLEAQLAVAHQVELRGEVADQTRSERARVLWAQRLVRAVDGPVSLRIRGFGALTGTVRDVGADWFTVLADPAGPQRHREVLVAQHAVLSVSGLPHSADQRPGAAQRRLDLRQALRALSRDRAVVRLTDIDGGQLTGTIDRVGRDHLDLADHAEDLPRRREAVRRRHTVPCPVLAALRRL